MPGASAAGAGRPPGSAVEVFVAALRLGLTSFGGPVAHLGHFRREYVVRRGWLDEARYADLLALAQSLPGASSSQVSLAIGLHRAGLRGGLAAWLGFTLPSAVVMVGVALFATGQAIPEDGWVAGLKVAAVAVVAQAVVAMARVLTPDLSRLAMAAVAGVVALALPSPFTQGALIAAGAAAGLLVLGHVPEPAREGMSDAADWSRAGGGQEGSGIPTGPAHVPVSRRVGAIALSAFVVLLVGLALLAILVPRHGVQLVDAFYRSGALVFGGGHVVLPLLQAAVVPSGWVDNDAFLAGYGLAQALPGPLFAFAGYLGAAAGPEPNGVAGALLATVAIFAPGLLLVIGALPWWAALRQRARARAARRGVNAVVVGILAAALVSPLATAGIRGPADALAALAGVALLATRRVPPIVVVGGCALAAELYRVAA